MAEATLKASLSYSHFKGRFSAATALLYNFLSCAAATVAANQLSSAPRPKAARPDAFRF